MSSTAVPWPGSRGASTVRPAAARASASGRMLPGLPVKPCSTRTPTSSPAAENGSAPGITACSGIGVLRAEGLGPPVLGRALPVGVGVDAVHRARVEALAAARAQLRDDDDVDPVVEDGPELRRAVPDAGVAVDALRHLDAQGRRLPLRVALALLDARLAV